MKNLLIFMSENGKFDTDRPGMTNDSATLIKVQIDSILELEWDIDDVMLVTNFPYEYRGVKALVIEGVEFFASKPQVTKINAILKLFELGLIKPETIYFFHDLDAYQMAHISKKETKMYKADLSLTDYGRMERWNTGVMFFTLKAHDLFVMMQKFCYEYKIDEERALLKMTHWYPEIKRRVFKLNITYNLQPRNMSSVFKMAHKPLKIAHFHPDLEMPKLRIKRCLDYYKGKNPVHEQLVTDNLLKIFANHGIK